MWALRGLIIALSTFSQIPVPRVSWESKARGWTLVFLPVAGVCIGALILLWHVLCITFGIGTVLQAVGYTLLPLLIVGAIHLDGFCDTTDALASNASMEKRLEILRDPHAGVFAVVAVAAYLLAFVGLATELRESWQSVTAFACIFVLSRSLAALATLSFPNMASSSFAMALRCEETRRLSLAVLLLWAAGAVAGMIWFGGWSGVAAAVIAVLMFVFVRFWLVRQFGGFSGDLAGWLIQMTEIGALAGLVFGNIVLTAL